jgi:RHS repeat-associated protein
VTRRVLQEEGGYEYASDHGSTQGKEETHIEPAVLVQPLSEDAGRSGAAGDLGFAVPLCVAGSEGPCARDAKGGPGATCGSNSTIIESATSRSHRNAVKIRKSVARSVARTTRIYTYDPDTNRTALTTREPNAKGECASEGGTIEKHTYDEADRLTDAGVSYNAFGDITALPATDAGGYELTSSYYTDNQVASQTQHEQTIGDNLDPAGRTLETILTGKEVADITSHYPGPANAPAWTVNTAGEWRRNITGISGSLVAIQNNGETPVLQLRNLHDDIIATAYKSETATELATKADTSEYGVPGPSAPAKYSWLGAIQIPTELPSGATTMGVRTYIPQLGRFLQPDPIPGGSANAYSYTFGNPLNTSDPTGESTIYELLSAHAAQVGHEAQQKEEAERRAAEEAAARAAAERAATEASWAALLAGDTHYAGWGGDYVEEYEEEEEEGSYEWASYNKDGSPEHREARVEPAILIQPLAGANEQGGAVLNRSGVQLCGVGVEGPCARDAKGGPGATCGSNSTRHRKCREPKPSKPGENQEVCGAIGGTIGGAIGGSIGGWFGGTIGAVGGAKAGEKICHE